MEPNCSIALIVYIYTILLECYAMYCPDTIKKFEFSNGQLEIELSFIKTFKFSPANTSNVFQVQGRHIWWSFKAQTRI